MLNQKGFSLVELMVGLILGLLASLAISKAFVSYDQQKTKTSGTADAQTNGSIALLNIQQSVQMAGYGLPIPMADKDSSSLKCAKFPDYDPDNNGSTDNSTNLFPVVIEDGAGDNGSDVIKVRYSNTAMGAIPVTVIDATNPISPGLLIENNIGCNDGDIALIMSGNACTMVTIEDANGNPDSKNMIGLSTFTTLGGPITNGARMSCMGDWQDYKYEIKGNELQLNGRSIVSEVVDMQAQYGVSAVPTNNQVNQWVDATGGTWSDPTIENRNRIKAIRIAVVTRNVAKNNEAVTEPCSSTTEANPSGLCAWDATSASPSIASPAPSININNIGGNEYRYRVFDTIIPIRNMIWSREAL